MHLHDKHVRTLCFRCVVRSHGREGGVGAPKTRRDQSSPQYRIQINVGVRRLPQEQVSLNGAPDRSASLICLSLSVSVFISVSPRSSNREAGFMFNRPIAGDGWPTSMLRPSSTPPFFLDEPAVLGTADLVFLASRQRRAFIARAINQRTALSSRRKACCSRYTDREHRNRSELARMTRRRGRCMRPFVARSANPFPLRTYAQTHRIVAAAPEGRARTWCKLAERLRGRRTLPSSFRTDTRCTPRWRWSLGESGGGGNEDEALSSCRGRRLTGWLWGFSWRLGA